jgi:hypothetical protein
MHLPDIVTIHSLKEEDEPIKGSFGSKDFHRNFGGISE